MKIVWGEHADQAVELLEPVLQRRGGEHHGFGCCVANTGNIARDLRLPRPIRAQPVGFIAHHQIPGADELVGLGVRELVRTDQDLITAAWGDKRVDVLTVHQRGGKSELLAQFLLPLLTQRGRGDDEDAALALCPVLADDDPGLDRLTQADLVSQDHSVRERGLQREQGCIDLVGFGLDLGIKQQTC
ncbi:Uncharacterised protein [Arcanobacterium haemolyticum]|nr:Uncharacterised protein [Arcanobacterium haemolyticum]